MKVILIQDMDELGIEGETVNVAKGYARNYLIPKGFALLANNRNVKLMETRKKKIEIKRIKQKESAEKIREELMNPSIYLKRSVKRKNCMVQ